MAVKEKFENVSYRSSRKSLCIHLRQARKEVHNGEIILIPGQSVRFTNGMYTATDPEIAEKLDEMLTGPYAMRWRRKFWRLPSQAVARKMAEAADMARRKEAEYLDKTMSADEKKEMSSFHDFIKKQRTISKNPTVHVTGTRDVGRGADGIEQPSETVI